MNELSVPSQRRDKLGERTKAAQGMRMREGDRNLKLGLRERMGRARGGSGRSKRRCVNGLLQRDVGPHAARASTLRAGLSQVADNLGRRSHRPIVPTCFAPADASSGC